MYMYPRRGWQARLHCSVNRKLSGPHQKSDVFHMNVAFAFLKCWSGPGVGNPQLFLAHVATLRGVGRCPIVRKKVEQNNLCWTRNAKAPAEETPTVVTHWFLPFCHHLKCWIERDAFHFPPYVVFLLGKPTEMVRSEPTVRMKCCT